ncbi:hypothetical protein [Vogesella sp. LIG4]|uniref:hypothetical protein n=1 Tax=Vogesella sp. LIG4 TaxID=1192162 RepID=UPI00081FDDEA|nr:hypothetical protein [Vogesella sp. LIG4]SCK08513.1 hypothetical protein PSELUDRAFT_0515 [Vogesella sp. LIG4]
MLKLLALLGLSTTLWWAALWLLIPVHWQQLSPTVMLLLHLLPPLLLTALVQLWRQRQARREQAAAQAQADAEAAEQQTRRDEARERHHSELRERQQVLHCRWLWVQALPQRDELAWLDELPEACAWQALTEDELEAGSPLDSLHQVAEEGLAALYEELPGAAALPLLLEVLPGTGGMEQVGRIKQWQQQAWQQQQGDAPQPASDCRFLPGSGTVADRVQQFLAQDPELPGAVLLALDAPHAAWSPDDEADDATRQQWREQGRPGAAVVLLLFLRAGLAAPASDAQAAADPYQPYWERDPASVNAGWGRVPAGAQQGLAALPLLACLAQSGQGTLGRPGTLQLTRQLQPLLDNALVNASLLDYPFSAEDADPQRNQADSVAWLVHNGGDVDAGGVRMAAIGSNLTRHQIGLDPVDEASNLVREWGHVGAATPALLTALTVTHCARLAAPAVLAQFQQDHAALSLARPA